MSRPNTSKSRVVLLFLALTALAVFYFINSAKEAKSPSSEWKRGEVVLASQKISVYLARTPLEHEVGLSAFDRLETNQGMLFVFDQPARPGFWMKGMKFPIDIVWIKDNQVIDITKNLPADSGSELTKYYPNQDVNYVLEVNAGWCDRNSIKPGDQVSISL